MLNSHSAPDGARKCKCKLGRNVNVSAKTPEVGMCKRLMTARYTLVCSKDHAVMQMAKNESVSVFDVNHLATPTCANVTILCTRQITRTRTFKFMSLVPPSVGFVEFSQRGLQQPMQRVEPAKSTKVKSACAVHILAALRPTAHEYRHERPRFQLMINVRNRTPLVAAILHLRLRLGWFQAPCSISTQNPSQLVLMGM